MKAKIAGLLNLKPLHVSIIALLYIHNPAHANHLQKIFPQTLIKKVQKKYDNETRDRLQSWLDLMATGAKLDDRGKLERVNHFFNRMKWVEDRELWGQKDYWATPLESLLKNAGDCEDFSIAKYFSLLHMGVSEEKLKISYVKYRQGQQAHMVLTYFSDPNSDPLILDNMNNDILKGSERTDLTPVFHLNSFGVWKNEDLSERLGNVDDIQQWKSMVQRLRREIQRPVS